MGHRPPPLVVFVVASLGLHVAAFGTLRRGHDRQAEFDVTSQTIAGESVDVEPPVDSPPPDPPPVSGEGDDRPAPQEHHTLATSPRSRGEAGRGVTREGVGEGAPGSGAPTPPAALFGAVGVRFATDLATTFTRAFPQTASADGIWTTLPFGSAGTADIALTLDDSGHIAASVITGDPSPALRRGIERTLSILAPRAFTSRAAVTKLRVSARVSRDDVHDGLHGDVFALSGGSFAGNVGTAFFALPATPGGSPARRIDVDLRLLP